MARRFTNMSSSTCFASYDRYMRYYHWYGNIAHSSTDSFGFGLLFTVCAQPVPLLILHNRLLAPLSHTRTSLARACIRSTAVHLLLIDLHIGGRSVICYATSTILQYIKLPSNNKFVEIDVTSKRGAKQLAARAEQRATSGHVSSAWVYLQLSDCYPTDELFVHVEQSSSDNLTSETETHALVFSSVSFLRLSKPRFN